MNRYSLPPPHTLPAFSTDRKERLELVTEGEAEVAKPGFDQIKAVAETPVRKSLRLSVVPMSIIHDQHDERRKTSETPRTVL
jgi:hypothetical protein